MKIEPFAPGNGVIFMKVGTHAGESLDDIVKRKNQELAEAGEIFWGYGGSTCHPLYHVQPFVKERLDSGHAIYLAMEPMNSRHFAEPKLAEQYSDDGVTWKSVPSGIRVKGSRYALVLASLDPVDTELHLGDLEVGIGTSAGRSATKFVRGHVDKGCFIVQPHAGGEASSNKHIGLVATLKAPYAVLLK